MSKRELLWITILGASVILGGCGETSEKEKKAQKLQPHESNGSREARRKLVEKVQKGWPGTRSPGESRNKNMSEE